MIKILFLGYHSRILKYFDYGYPRNSEDSYCTLDILKKDFKIMDIHNLKKPVRITTLKFACFFSERLSNTNSQPALFQKHSTRASFELLMKNHFCTSLFHQSFSSLSSSDDNQNLMLETIP